MAPPPRDRRPRPDDDRSRRRTSGDQGRSGRGRSTSDRDAANEAAWAERRRERARQEERAPRRWGGVARRGTRELAPDVAPGSASDAWRRAVERTGRPPEWEPERWEREPDDEPAPGRDRRAATGRGAATGRPRRPTTSDARGRQRRRPTKGATSDATTTDRPARPRRKAPPAVATELERVVGARKAPRIEERLMEAARAYDRERYADARRMVARLAEEAPAAPAVRELHGLTLYRLGKWRDAAKELEAYRTLTGDVDQHPVLADCYRALRRYKKVDELWDELREASPAAELVAEGRIVAAGALADQGRIDDAIALLERGRLTSKRPREHHLRLWYALADLYERAGDVPRARELFKRVIVQERDFADAAERLSGLG